MSETVASKQRILSPKAASILDWSLVGLLVAIGLLHPGPKMFYDSLWRVFLSVVIPVHLLSLIAYLVSERTGQRIQGVRRKKPPILKEAAETTRAMFVVACLAAWPVGMYRMGLPTGMAWTLSDMGIPWWAAALQMIGGIVVVDAWTYWKHRILHTKALFAFHRSHHTFRDPTPFASFAVGPLETLLTFWPLLLICWPTAKHFAPMYFSAITGFVCLNLYLHCGVTFVWMERILPKVGLNSSAWHNAHHSHVNVNFGEVSFIWDRLCNTASKPSAPQSSRKEPTQEVAIEAAS